MKTAQQANANWKAAAPTATAAYDAGVQGYQGDWATATTNQQAALLLNVTQAINDGSWAAGVRRVGTGGWKTATTDKKGNYTTGYTAGANAQLLAAQKLMAFLGTVVPNLPARGTYQQNKTRWETLVDALHAQKGNLGAAAA